MNRIEYEAQSDWLRNNPHGARAALVRRDLRRYEREHGKPSTSERRTLIRGFVAFWPDRPDQPVTSVVIHQDHLCSQIAHLDDREIREATTDERERLPPCSFCG